MPSCTAHFQLYCFFRTLLFGNSGTLQPAPARRAGSLDDCVTTSLVFCTSAAFLGLTHTVTDSLLLPSVCCAMSLQSRPTLYDPMSYSPPGSSVHRILQARILKWFAIFLLQGIFLTQELNLRLLCLLHLLHCRQILYPLSHPGSPLIHTHTT